MSTTNLTSQKIDHQHKLHHHTQSTANISFISTVAPLVSICNQQNQCWCQQTQPGHCLLLSLEMGEPGKHIERDEQRERALAIMKIIQTVVVFQESFDVNGISLISHQSTHTCQDSLATLRTLLRREFSYALFQIYFFQKFLN